MGDPCIDDQFAHAGWMKRQVKPTAERIFQMDPGSVGLRDSCEAVAFLSLKLRTCVHTVDKYSLSDSTSYFVKHRLDAWSQSFAGNMFFGAWDALHMSLLCLVRFQAGQPSPCPHWRLVLCLNSSSAQKLSRFFRVLSAAFETDPSISKCTDLAAEPLKSRRWSLLHFGSLGLYRRRYWDANDYGSWTRGHGD